MKRIYFTAIPLESNFVLQPCEAQPVNFELTDRSPRCFPIIRIMAQTMQPGDEAVAVLVRQKNSEHNANYDLFLQELESLHLEQVKIRDVVLPECQDSNVIADMFLSLMDVLESDCCYYACMTFGTKIWPLVLSSVLSYAEKVLDNTQVKGLYYQEVLRENGVTVNRRIYDMSVLFSLNSVVELMAGSDSKDASAALRMLLGDEP